MTFSRRPGRPERRLPLEDPAEVELSGLTCPDVPDNGHDAQSLSEGCTHSIPPAHSAQNRIPSRLPAGLASVSRSRT